MKIYKGDFTDADYFIFMDENGDADMKYVATCYNGAIQPDQNSRSFCLSSVMIKSSDIPGIHKSLDDLKCKYWPHGQYEYKKGKTMKVCLHSREIRRSTGPFSKNCIDYGSFQEDLTKLIQNAPFSITSAYIDKYNLYRQYTTYARNPYNLAVTFILERIVKHQLKDTETAIIILESRGKKEDPPIQNTIQGLIDYGTQFVTEKQFEKIKGIYFDPKRDPEDATKTFSCLELADLVSYPLYNYCKNNKTGRDYDVVKKKLAPYGLKVFP